MTGDASKAAVGFLPDGASASGGGPGPGRMNRALGERRLHLAALSGAIEGWAGAETYGLSHGLVLRAGGAPVLFVARQPDTSRVVDVGCERFDGPAGGWWYLDVRSGERIARVEDVRDVPGALVALLEGSPGGGAGSAGGL